jgi:hypothetical protein
MSQANPEPNTKKRPRQDDNQASTAPTTNYHQQLCNDYSTIASLLADLNEESAQFSSQMDRIVSAVPSHDGLATLWQEQAQVLEHNNDTKDKTNGSKQGEDNTILEDQLNPEDEDAVILL